MLVSLKLGEDFSRGVQVRESATHFSRPTPTLPFVDRFMPLLSASKQVSASHRSECLLTAPISCA
jgi:hypothetical protein